jgi:hypothetical protein
MNSIIWWILGIIVALGIALLFEEVRNLLLNVWEWMLDIGEMMIDFFSNLDDLFSGILDGGDTPLLNIWFWLFYIVLMACVWILPSKLGLADYKFWEKIMYTIIFFGVDYFIIQRFMD